MSHDKFNVLSLETSVVDFLAIILFFFLLSLGLGGLALTLVGVVVTGVCVRASGSLGGGELLGSVDLGLSVQVFNLGFTEDAIYCELYPFLARESYTYIQVLEEGER